VVPGPMRKQVLLSTMYILAFEHVLVAVDVPPALAEAGRPGPTGPVLGTRYRTAAISSRCTPDEMPGAGGHLSIQDSAPHLARSLRAWVLPALVIGPWARRSPLESSAGTKPR
jgi:hypothetical protein